MSYARFILCIALLLVTRAQAQSEFEPLLHKTYAQRIDYLKKVIENIAIGTSDSAAFSGIERFRAFAKKHDDKELILEADLMTAYHLKKYSADFALVDHKLNEVIGKAIAEGIVTTEARTRDMLADHYFKGEGLYEQAFDELFKLGKLLESIPDDVLPDKLYHIYHIGEAYYFFGDYREAIDYFKRALLIKPVAFNLNGFNATRNTLGLCYRHLGILDSSDHYFNLLLDKKGHVYNEVWAGIAKGNLGYNCYLRGEYEKAIPLFSADIKAAVAMQDWGLACGSLIPLADIYFKQGRIADAERLIWQAKKYVILSDQYHRYETLYPLLSKLYAAKGQTVLSNLYLDSTVFVKDSLARKFSALQLLRAQQKSVLQQHQAEMEKVGAEKKVKTLERNLLIAFVLVAMIGALYVYNNQQRRHKNQKFLLDMQIAAKEKELLLATVQLKDFARSISEKNQLIETLENQFGANSNNAALEQLRQVTILTDEEWENFRSLFGEVHSGYLQRLKEKLPGLTPAETRFMALAKLQLSNKEMAAVLGVSTQNIRTIWYRLRKKLNLPEEGGIEELAESI
jgi:tetratricopeptide (TPR) repeat protein